VDSGDSSTTTSNFSQLLVILVLKVLLGLLDGEEALAAAI
jgi:hypothetical protein